MDQDEKDKLIASILEELACALRACVPNAYEMDRTEALLWKMGDALDMRAEMLKRT